MTIIKLTKSAIENLPYPQTGQTLYFDSDVKGFGVCIGKRSKTYFVQGTANNRRIRYSLGRHGIITADQARGEARVKLAEMYQGIDPVQKQRSTHADLLSVKDALKEYLEDRKTVSPVTASGYEGNLRLYIPEWLNRPLVTLTKAEILTKHRQIGENHGHSAANKTMHVMRMLFNYTHAKYDNSPDNPCRYLTLLKAWYKTDRKRTYIKPDRLATWYSGVQFVVNPAIRDYLILLLFTGLRKTEAANLRWENIDLINRSLTIKLTKNGDPHTLPISDFLFDLFTARKQACGSSPWVFPGHG